MFHSRILNNKINKVHERALRLVYKNDDLNFQELLDLDNSVTIHQNNLQTGNRNVQGKEQYCNHSYVKLV